MERLDRSRRMPFPGNSLTHTASWLESQLPSTRSSSQGGLSILKATSNGRGVWLLGCPWLGPHPCLDSLLELHSSSIQASDSKSGEDIRGWPHACTLTTWRLGSDCQASIAALVGAGLCLTKEKILLNRKGECEAQNNNDYLLW